MTLREIALLTGRSAGYIGLMARAGKLPGAIQHIHAGHAVWDIPAACESVIRAMPGKGRPRKEKKIGVENSHS